METQDKEYEPLHHEIELNPKVGLVGHGWTQQGPMLICRTCPYEHSQFVPPNLIYKGLDAKGLPILEKM